MLWSKCFYPSINSLFSIRSFVLFVYFKVYKGVSSVQGFDMDEVICALRSPLNAFMRFCIFLNDNSLFNKLMEINVFWAFNLLLQVKADWQNWSCCGVMILNQSFLHTYTAR